MSLSKEILQERFTSSFDTFKTLFRNSNNITSLESLSLAFCETIKEFQNEVEKQSDKKLTESFNTQIEEIKKIYSNKWAKIAHTKI